LRRKKKKTCVLAVFSANCPTIQISDTEARINLLYFSMVTVHIGLYRLVTPRLEDVIQRSYQNRATARYFFGTFAYGICFYGIYFYGIYIYVIFFYRALKFLNIDLQM
jgi:hypothetical protein